ncbi:CxxH/CxxC protein [Pullulanibacillus sp. KACC 23026]|uniref:CxxH/CxxC protein n=1 Tax=Pullulanibacillus sp. KACC 23026 TaxID=3028315 RepID=UPI0023AE6FF5|nr:CxxH/CxxC protein [Pullulanibacillus sp. KACC 23026]WEG12816.1 CxxH/CxxC protein [Pullulanibacillus sp. KACC 23026]
MEESYFVCEDHVDLALEAAAESTLRPPLLEKVSHTQSLSTACEYCKNRAVYVVTNTYSHTEC